MHVAHVFTGHSRVLMGRLDSTKKEPAATSAFSRSTLSAQPIRVPPFHRGRIGYWLGLLSAFASNLRFDACRSGCPLARAAVVRGCPGVPGTPASPVPVEGPRQSSLRQVYL